MRPPEPAICGTCRRQLLTVSGPVGSYYIHGPSQCPAPSVLVEPMPGDQLSVCDFCAGPAPVWEYPAGDIVLYDVEFEQGCSEEFKSVDAYLACEGCHGFIELGQWRLLADRIVSMNPGVRSQHALLVRQMREFGDRRQGPAVPWSA